MPEQIGHYRILQRIGEGGMGEVFCAEDMKLGRNVALKVLPSEFAEDSKRLGRFQREARLASNLNHPNVTHIYEVGEENGIHYIAMEYVEGITLQEKLKNGPLPYSELLRIALQVAEGLQTAHEAGIVHRDVKPANIMMNSKDQVKILDFGLAKQDWSGRPDIDHISTEAYTQAGTLLGTVYYMSPEQALGKEVDQRSDIFSFGAVLYEMATGRRPFEGPNVTATIAQILATQPPAPVRVNPQLNEGLSHIIERCLRKNRDERYPSVDDLLRDLRSIHSTGGMQTWNYPAEKEYSMSRRIARALFIALQCMYLAFYIAGLKWNDAMEASLADLLGTTAATYLSVAYICSAILGMALRLHMIFLVLWDHVSAGVQFRKVFPMLFALDALWAFAPFGLLRKVSGYLLLACIPPLAFSPFSQRTLIRSAYDLYSNRRV